MKITIESTSQIVQVQTPTGDVPARIWEGHTDSGIAVVCLVTRIAAESTQDLSQFDRELRATHAPSSVKGFPSRPRLEEFPLRMLL